MFSRFPVIYLRIAVATLMLGLMAGIGIAQTKPIKEETPTALTEGLDPFVTEANQFAKDPDSAIEQPAKSSDAPAEDAAPAEKTEEEKAKELAEENQVELDTLVLGPWAIVTKDGASSKITAAALRTATERCIAPFKVQKLDIEPDAERKLPKPQQMLGDLVYFRTDKGLQRFDSATGRMYLLNRLQKIKKNNRTIWAVRGRAAGFRIRFAASKSRPTRAQLMLEEGALYLRCGFLKARSQKQQNDG